MNPRSTQDQRLVRAVFLLFVIDSQLTNGVGTASGRRSSIVPLMRSASMGSLPH